MPHPSETVALAADGASATIALCGAEPLSWRIGGRELIWHGDPAHWAQRAPILFPVVGASAGGAVRVESDAAPRLRARPAVRSRRAAAGPGAASPSRDERHAAALSLPLRARGRSRPRRRSPSLRFTVTNADDRPMPYGLGFHPGFPWPFDGGSGEGYRLLSERPQAPGIPDITADGLLRPGLRRAPFDGCALPLARAMFTAGALVLRGAGSGPIRFEAPSGRAIVLEREDFPHLALWTKPGAPFRCIEPWTGEPDTDGFSGELCERASIRMLTGGTTAEHVVTMRFAER